MGMNVLKLLLHAVLNLAVGMVKKWWRLWAFTAIIVLVIWAASGDRTASLILGVMAAMFVVFLAITCAFFWIKDYVGAVREEMERIQNV